MSKLKTKIKIGYADIKIKLLNKKDNPKWCKDHFGEYDSNKSEILINSSLSKIEEANTFLHELLHASIWISGLSTEGSVLEQKKREEIVVNALANNLAQVFRDNKWILPYLKTNLTGVVISEQKTGNRILGRNKRQHKKRSFSKN
jgi:hypothetical protein